MIKKYLCVFIIAFGVSLDTYFNAFRFLADGLPLVVAVGAGVALEILLSFTVYNSRGSTAYKVLATVITAYIVIQTSAGQTFALLSHTASVGQTTATDTASFTISECKKNILRLASEADTINAQLRSLQSAEARSLYSITIANANRRLDLISAERARNADTLLKVSSSVVSDSKTGEARKSIYNFYSSIPSWTGSDWLKFIFHFFLSVLIAIMAPVGILTWGRTTITATTFSRQQIEMFVAAAWYKIRNNTGSSILSEMEYNALLQRRGHIVESGVYFTLSNRCVNMNLINTSGIALERNHVKVITKLAGEKENLFKGQVAKWKQRIKSAVTK